MHWRAFPKQVQYFISSTLTIFYSTSSPFARFKSFPLFFASPNSKAGIRGGSIDTVRIRNSPKYAVSASPSDVIGANVTSSLMSRMLEAEAEVGVAWGDRKWLTTSNVFIFARIS